MASSKEVGNLGEDIASEFLEMQGYTIVERNYHSRFGEIDIIASKNEYLVFVEVKYRKNNYNGYPREAVTRKKQEKIKKTAMQFIIQGIENQDFCFRFDVIEILNGKIEHIENAFQ